jgi:hypothetical protein
VKRQIDIEKLLIWAYREELAKRSFIETLGIGNSFGDTSQLGTRIGGGAPQWYAELIGGGIHDDALTAELAVNDLKGWKLVLPDPTILLADMPGMMGEADAALSGYRLQLDGLIARMAQLASSPPWLFDKPERRIVRDPRSGAPLWFAKKKARCRSGDDRWFEEREVDGYDRTAQRPMTGAYRKYTWDPEPGVIVDPRYDWLAWAFGLKRIAESIAPHLKAFELIMPGEVTLPWARSTPFEARLEKPDLPIRTPQFTKRAVDAGHAAAARLQQGKKQPLTAAGT